MASQADVGGRSLRLLEGLLLRHLSWLVGWREKGAGAAAAAVVVVVTLGADAPFFSTKMSPMSL